MEFCVEQSVLDLGVKIVFAMVEGMDNAHDSAEWNRERAGRVSLCLSVGGAGRTCTQSLSWRGSMCCTTMRTCGAKHNVPAPVTLIKLLAKRGDAPYINMVLDIYNTVSMETHLALGAHDLAHVEGDVTLRMCDGSERYVPLGESGPVAVAAG